MPTVNNLLDAVGKKTEKPVATKADVQTVTVGTSGEVAVNDLTTISNAAPLVVNQSNSAIALPSFLEESNLPAVADRPESAYVGFCSNRSKRFAEMVAAGLRDGDPFIYSNKIYTKLDPMKFWLVGGTTFMSQMVGQEGNLVYCYKGKEVPSHHKPKVPDITKVQPHYVVFIIIELNGKLIPMKGDLRGTKSNCVESAINCVRVASLPDWLTRSDAHKATAAFPQPWGRVFTVVTPRPYTAKSSGNNCTIADGFSGPASITQMQMLVDAFKNPDFMKELNDIHTSYMSRVKFLEDASAKLGFAS